MGSFFVCGCGEGPPVLADSSAPEPDAAVDDDASVMAPAIPWLAAEVPPIGLSPCPEGWREVREGGITECDPYPEGGSEACGAGEAHFPGEPGCRTVGDPCPVGDYATDLPADDTVVYVKAGAAAGGDGTFASPYGALSELSWSAIDAGTTIALAKGSYEGPLLLRAGARVIGACAAMTNVTSVDDSVVGVLLVTSAGEPAVAENLTISNSVRRGVVVRDGRALHLRGVVVEGARDVALFAGGGGTALALWDVAVRDTRPIESDGTQGRGIEVVFGASLTATRLVLSRNHSEGIVAHGPRTTFTLSDAVVRNTLPQESNRASGAGLVLQEGARGEAARLLLTGNRSVAAFVTGDGTVLTVTDGIFQNTMPRLFDGQQGRGVDLSRGARLDATRLVIADNHETGVFADGEDTTATFTDVVVRDTQPLPDYEFTGRGILARAGAHVDATRLLVSDNEDTSLRVSGLGSTASLTDVLIRRTEPNAMHEIAGLGIALDEGAHLEAVRLVVAESHDLGLFLAGEGTVATLADVVVQDTLPGPLEGLMGRGIQLQSGARMSGERLVVDQTWQLGLIVYRGAHAELRDLSITNVNVAACAGTTCPAEGYGYGASSVGGTLVIETFRVDGAATCGVFVSPIAAGLEPLPIDVAPSLDLRSGLVSNSTIGACVQVDGYDFGRLSVDVDYLDNATNLDSTSLPVPSVEGRTPL